MRRLLLLPALVLVAACGGGEDEKDAYVERAAAICQDAKADFEALSVPTTAEGFAPYADSLVQVMESAERDLSALTPPEDDRAELEQKVLEPFSDLVAAGREFAGDVKAAGTDQVRLLGLLSQRPTAEAIDTEYLRTYGLTSCADAIELAG